MSTYCLGNNQKDGLNYLAVWQGKEVYCATKEEAEKAWRIMHPAWDDTGLFRSGDADKTNPIPL